MTGHLLHPNTCVFESLQLEFQNLNFTHKPSSFQRRPSKSFQNPHYKLQYTSVWKRGLVSFWNTQICKAKTWSGCCGCYHVNPTTPRSVVSWVGDSSSHGDGNIMFTSSSLYIWDSVNEAQILAAASRAFQSQLVGCSFPKDSSHILRNHKFTDL